MGRWKTPQSEVNADAVSAGKREARQSTMGARATNHHVVPQVLQKAFSIQNDPKRVWRAKRSENGTYKDPERKLIEKAFVVRDYYTILENEGLSDRIERNFYGPIDDFLGRLLPEVLDALTRGAVPRFSPQALSSLREVVLRMAMRTPDFVPGHDDVEMGRQVAAGTLSSLPEDVSAADREKLLSILDEPRKLREIGRSVRVKATLNLSPRIDASLSDLDVRWAVSSTKHSYILASRMAYRIGNGGQNGLSNPNMEIWMPISPKTALVLLRDPKNEVPHIVGDSPDHIRKVNEYAVRNSFEVASHSKELLASLLASC